MLSYLEGKYQTVLDEIRSSKVISKENEEKLQKALTAFGKGFGKGEVAQADPAEDEAEAEEEKPKAEEKPKKKKAKKAE